MKYFFIVFCTKFLTTFVYNIFYLDVRKGDKIFTKNNENFYRWDVVDEMPCLRTDIRINLSHNCLSHTPARLADMRKSKSNLISLILARYDFFEIPLFSMTDGPSSGHEGK